MFPPMEPRSPTAKRASRRRPLGLLLLAAVVGACLVHVAKAFRPRSNETKSEYITAQSLQQAGQNLLAGDATSRATLSPTRNAKGLPGADLHTASTQGRTDMLAIIAASAEDLSWLLEDPDNGTSSPLVPTELYIPADVGEDCRPDFPGAAAADPAPSWPRWAQAYVDAKCSYRGEVKPGSVQDAERAASLQAGLPWKGKIVPQQVQLAVTPAGQAGAVEAHFAGAGGLGQADSKADSKAADAADSEASGSTQARALDPPARDAAPTHGGSDAATVAGGVNGNNADPSSVEAKVKQFGAVTAGQRRLQNTAGPVPSAVDTSLDLPLQPTTAATATQPQAVPGAARENVVFIPSRTPLPVHIVPSQGRESMAYLTTIIDHYDEMKQGHGPSLLMFMHGHQQAWHTLPFGQDWVLKRLRALPPRNLTGGMMQLGCLKREESHMFTRVVDANHVSANGPRWRESMVGHYMQAWLEPGGLGELFGEALPPPYIQAACCASFAVSREAILRRPRPFYEALRTWLLTTPMERYWSGVILEFTFHMAFTGRAVYDPPVEQCRAELYDM